MVVQSQWQSAVSDSDQLLAELRRVFASDRTRPLQWRLDQLRGIERLVEERESEIAAALADDLGRSAVEAWLGDVASKRAEVAYPRKHLKKWVRRRRTSRCGGDSGSGGRRENYPGSAGRGLRPRTVYRCHRDWPQDHGCGRTHVDPCTLELGGKSPVIVATDADLDVTARRVAWVKLLNAGQTCIAPDYVIAEESIADELGDKIVANIREFRSAEQDSSMRVVNQRQFDRLVSLISETDGKVATGRQAAQ